MVNRRLSPAECRSIGVRYYPPEETDDFNDSNPETWEGEAYFRAVNLSCFDPYTFPSWHQREAEELLNKWMESEEYNECLIEIEMRMLEGAVALCFNGMAASHRANKERVLNQILERYSPNQPRQPNGEFGSGGSLSPKEAKAKAAKDKKEAAAK